MEELATERVNMVGGYWLRIAPWADIKEGKDTHLEAFTARLCAFQMVQLWGNAFSYLAKIPSCIEAYEALVWLQAIDL